MKLLPVQPFRQSEGYCGPACLKMVCAYYGVERSEREMAKLAGSTRAHGTPGERLVRAARRLGFQATLHDRATYADILRSVNDRKIPVIVNWFSTDEGHYSVAVGVDQKRIYLQDPELGRLRALDRGVFQRVWFDFRGDCLRTPRDMVIRRMIVIERMQRSEKAGA